MNNPIVDRRQIEISDVFAVHDGGNAITLHFGEIKSAKAFRDAFPPGIISAAPSQPLLCWQTMETAPREGSIIVWWPIVKLDEYGDSTEEIVDGQSVISEWNGGYWLEPEVLNAIGDQMGDDFTYADNPSHWMPLPAQPVATSEESPC